MFRESDNIDTTARFTHETHVTPVHVRKSALAIFDTDEEIGALKHVYSEIARRLSRNAYTSHTIAHAR
jgi:hypothetical protein